MEQPVCWPQNIKSYYTHLKSGLSSQCLHVNIEYLCAYTMYCLAFVFNYVNICALMHAGLLIHLCGIWIHLDVNCLNPLIAEVLLEKRRVGALFVVLDAHILSNSHFQPLTRYPASSKDESSHTAHKNVFYLQHSEGRGHLFNVRVSLSVTPSKREYLSLKIPELILEHLISH